MGIPRFSLIRRLTPIAVLGTLIFGGLVVTAPGSAAVSTPPDLHRHITGDVYESVYTVATGSGPFDKIQVHRIVREKHGRPIKTNNAVMLLHGDAWGFDAAFMRASSSVDTLPVFLAKHGVDVWGVDLAWTLVPRQTENLDFMAHWGLQHDINDLSDAIAFAREIRQHTGSGSGPLTLGGWSHGGWIGYALLSQESQLPKAKRQVRSFVSIDNFFKTGSARARAAQCDIADTDDGYIAAGDYAFDFSATADIGHLAKTDPNGISPYYGAPYTNLGAALSYGAAGFQFGQSFSPWYHFAGGIFPNGDTNRDPTGLRFTRIGAWEDFLMGVGAYEPVKLLADAARVTCDDGTTRRFDGHLKDIDVPILYVGAAGGFGTYGLYSMNQTASHDKAKIIARTLPIGQERRDVGHVDLFYARHAESFTWRGILRWLDHHTHCRPHQRSKSWAAAQDG